MRIIGNNPAAENAEITAVASGTLPNGKPVIVNADGTVSVVSGTDESIPAGSEYVFNSGDSSYNFIAFDPNTANKFVIVYKDVGNSNYGTAIVGTVSGTSISFGSEYVFNSARVDWLCIAFDPNTANKFVISYLNAGNSSYGTAIVGTVSGTSISFGSGSVFNSAQSPYNSIAFDPNTANKFVIVYRDNGNTYGTAIVGTVSGTSISYGSESVFNSGSVYETVIAFDPNTANKFVISYQDVANSNYGTAIVGTVSGTSISYGSESVFNSASTASTFIAFDPNTANKFVIVYKDAGNSDYGTAIVGTVSGTTISFGSEYVFNSGITFQAALSFDPNISNTFAIVYRDAGNSSYGTAIVGTVSGTSISYGSESAFNNATTTYTGIAFDPNTANNFVIVYKDGGNSSYGTAIVCQTATTALTSENFIGFANGAASDTGTARVQIGSGINGAQSGLTAGQQYFVQGDGTIGLTAADPSVIAGTAISATEIIVKG